MERARQRACQMLPEIRDPPPGWKPSTVASGEVVSTGETMSASHGSSRPGFALAACLHWRQEYLRYLGWRCQPEIATRVPTSHCRLTAETGRDGEGMASPYDLSWTLERRQF